MNLIFCNPVYARMVVLVYDDSGSMSHKSLKWEYANYSAQMLSAFLRQDDNFYSVLMSTQKVYSHNLQTNRQSEINNIRKHWGEANNHTYFKAVENAVNKLISKYKAIRNFDQEEKDWLIITTDGEFEDHKYERIKDKEKKNKMKNKTQKKLKMRAKKSISNLIKYARGKVRIVFLLIGKNASKIVPDTWKNEAQEQVEIIEAKNQSQIVKGMADIVSMITERDYKTFMMNHQNNTIQFYSHFPLRQFSIMHQETKGKPLDIKQIVSPKGSLLEQSAIDYLKITRHHIQLSAGVYHCNVGSILPAGNYKIILDEQVDKHEIKLILETAVGIKCVLLNKMKQKLFIKNGFANISSGSQVQVGAILMHTYDDKHIELTREMIQRIKMHMCMGAVKPMYYSQKENMFLSESLSGQIIDRQSFYLEAVCPEYFNIKTDVITINSKKYITKSIQQIELTQEVPYSFTKEYTSIDKFISIPLEDIPVNQVVSSQEYQIEAIDLPQGLNIHINQIPIRQNKGKVKIPLGEQDTTLTMKILRNDAFGKTPIQGRPDDYPVKLRLTGTITGLTQERQAIIRFKPAFRNINIHHQDNIKWDVPITKMNEARPYTLSIDINGNPVTNEEFKYWSISLPDISRINLMGTKEYDAALFNIYVSPYLNCPCFTATGAKVIDVKISSPFPKEVFHQKVKLNIQDEFWLYKCFSLIMAFFYIVIFFLYLVGLIKKPRFSKERVITCYRIHKKIKSKKKTESLTSGWFFRYFVPYIPERKAIGKFVFYPGQTADAVILRKDQARKNIYLDGFPQEAEWTYDLRFGLNSTLSEKIGERTDYYIYQ